MSDDRPLRVRREEAGWTQEQLARAAGVTAATVCRMERTSGGTLESWERVETALERRVRAVLFERRMQARETIGGPLPRPGGAEPQRRPS